MQPSAALPPVGIPGKVACMMESTRARVLKGSCHVGKDRNTEAAQDETGVEHAAQGLERGRGHITLRGVTGNCPLPLELDSRPSICFLLFAQPFDLFPGLPYFVPKKCLSATMSHR